MALERSSDLIIPHAKFLILRDLYESDLNHEKAEECTVRRFERAEFMLQTSLKLCTPDDLHGQANSLFKLAQLYNTQHRRSETEEYLARALYAYTQLQDLVGQANVVLHQAQMLADVRHSLEQALVLLKEHNNHASQVNAILELAHVLIQSDQLSDAQTLLLSPDLKRDFIHVPGLSATLAWLYICGGNFDKAEHYLVSAGELFQQQANKVRQAEVLLHLGIVHTKSNRPDKAEQALNAIPDLDTWEYIFIQSRRLWVLGDLRIVQGRLDEADSLLGEALTEIVRHNRGLL
ncbi:hypothetical protein BDN70DRAFT_896687 [Pholiota conissans]|uniref:MalT-like TPR region domain-containing protein n=1 Tax=Pholiota conissans TaxID=109636 RepID=A0A9P5YWV5_9AGAR|nr:hypothetical protein BDN70DRAFT_896687 [Pholiota conissans]